MPLKDILVFLDSAPPYAARLDLALELARRHGARLSALFAGPEDATVLQQFIAQTSSTPVAATWLSASELPGEDFNDGAVRHARSMDLIIVGQSEREGINAGVPADLPERLVLGAGRPVLVVPYAGEFPNVGRRVVIGWHGDRESVRAVNDALALLQGAETVELLTVVQGKKDEEVAHMTAELHEHLGRHGVSAAVKQMAAGPIAIGDVLLNRASDEGADLLVIGAHATGYFGSPVLGETGRHLLEHLALPVLMSH